MEPVSERASEQGVKGGGVRPWKIVDLLLHVHAPPLPQQQSRQGFVDVGQPGLLDQQTLENVEARARGAGTLQGPGVGLEVVWNEVSIGR